jgi:hypothetical protein
MTALSHNWRFIALVFILYAETRGVSIGIPPSFSGGMAVAKVQYPN